MLVLNARRIDLSHLVDVAAGEKVRIEHSVERRVRSSRKVVEKLANSGNVIYGVNTGFGSLVTSTIHASDLKDLQRNIIRSHASGHGALLGREETRAMMFLRAVVLLKGLTGVRFEICERLIDLLNRGVHPCIPESGSVGASGDLAPLAHLALTVIGEGNCEYQGRITKASAVHKELGLKPITLEMKEGLSLVNGTQAMCAVGGLALYEALRLSMLADLCAAFTGEGRSVNVTAYDRRIAEARGHLGQILSAKRISALLTGSTMCGKASSITRVQDAYSFRCVPQVHGASIDALEHAREVLERELNGATDNPLVFGDEILSGGNFHGQPLALAFDYAAMALAELGSISERRIEQLLNASLSGFPAFLAPNPGLNSGFMAAQYLAASLVNENKILTHPASTDSIPTCANIEDHVSMGMTSALKLRKIVRNVYAIFAVELMCAAQAREMRIDKPKRDQIFAPRLAAVQKVIRKQVRHLEDDRVIATDIDTIVGILKTSALERAAGLV